MPLRLPAQQNRLAVSPPHRVAVKHGTEVTAALRVEVQPGFHVNSDKPKDEFLIPLKLTWTSGPLQAESVSYPKPEDIKVGNEVLSVFTGEFNLKTQFKAPANTAPGAATMKGKLRYQACNNRMCFRPVTLDVRLPVLIE
ncbi:MAG: protein-disulfide reductase DsbD domain-containing protein [Bryobacteraceae bacterium]